MSEALKKIQDNIEPLRQQIINHKVYETINSLKDLKIFMQYHVYAIWDFMSLLKALQINLTCTTVPWFPVGSANTRYLINEIVASKESDIDSFGTRKSHFEMYLDAMQQCGADTDEIHRFLASLKEKADLSIAFQAAGSPEHAVEFVDFTFKIIRSNQAHLQAGTFTFGREDLIPDRYISIVNDLNNKFPEQLSLFKYYLDRDIAIDRDYHSYLALAMTTELCSDDQACWQEVEQVSITSLQKRIYLWDGAYAAILKGQAL